LDLDSDALARAGVSRDSAVRLIQILGNAGVPLTVGGIPDSRTIGSASFAGRFDRAIPASGPSVKPPPQSYMIVGGNYSEARGSSLAPTAAPANTGKSSRDGAFVQGMHSRYLGSYGDYANETSASISFDETRGTPYLVLPGGSVLITSALPGEASTL